MAIVNGRNLNWKASPPDERDQQLKKKLTHPVTYTPKSDLSLSVPFILNQGTLGSCVGNAFAYVYMIMQAKHKMPIIPPSRLFAYGMARKLEDMFNQDAGCYLRDCIKGVVKFGVPHEELWPYDESKFATEPTEEAYEQAELHQITGYNRLSGSDDFRASLSLQLPIMFGVTLWDSFMFDQTKQTGVVIMPNEQEERVIGGHAMCIVGHDDFTRKFLGVQSWGEWGHGGGVFQTGFFTMPYQYIDKYCDEAWNIIAGEEL